MSSPPESDAQLVARCLNGQQAAWAMLVQIFLAAGDQAGARQMLDRALAINPGAPELFALDQELNGSDSLLPPP